MTNKQLSWRYQTVPQSLLNNRVIRDQRGKTLGGSSSINGMIYCRGAAQDYDQWATLGVKGWSYADVLPYFKRSEDHQLGADQFHGAGGPLRVSRVELQNPLSRA
jgi:choline dehydrogenase